MFFRTAKKRRIELARLSEGTGYSVEHLLNKHERIEWSAFVRFMKNAGEIWTQDELIALSAVFLRSPFVRSIFTPARLLFGASDLYKWAIGQKRGGGRHLFNCIENDYAMIDANHARLDLTLPPGYEPCPEFFLISRGVFSELPTLLGLERANVLMTPVGSGVRYDIEIPVERGFLHRTRRALAKPFTLWTAGRELKEAHEILLIRYEEIELAKRELAELNKSLERKVEERTAELRLTIAQLKEAQRTRDELFANINHEIRTPLSLVLLSVIDLQSRLGVNLDPAARLRLDSIQGSARRLLRLVDALLLLAARQEGKLKLAVVGTDIAPLLRELVSSFGPVAESHGLNLSFAGPERFIVAVDPAALDRMITNLVSNAVKFTPSGGSVEVTLVDAGANAEIAVRDTGIGIDDEFRKRIFGRFEQGRASVHSGTHGSGIGLSLVRDLAEAHGGGVDLESQSGGGTTFTVRIPRGAAIARSVDLANDDEMPQRALPSDFGLRAASPDRREIMEPTGSSRGTILVAEDDPDLRLQIASILATEFRVLLAPDGLAALRLARAHLPDMLVTDVGMPGMNGLELTRKFRELDGNRLAPVLLLTAYGNLGDRLKGFDAGAVDYVLKPFEPAELKARILSQLSLREMALKLHESEKLAALGVLSSGLAHELRNPANGIVNAVEPLKALLPPHLVATDVPTGQLLKVIEDCSRQVGVLAKQLLGLRSPTELLRSEESFATILQRALSLVSPAMEKVTLKNECSYLGGVWCSGGLVTQVIANLIENGGHAAGSGGWVKISNEIENGVFAFEVTDSGPGVPVANREKVFEPFFTTKDPGVGTGLGLTTARDIARKHGGNLLIRDGGNGSGTVFRLEIPLQPTEERRTAS